MQEQGIPFYRFNPQLDEVIPSGETDLSKLLNMLIKVPVQLIAITTNIAVLLIGITDESVHGEPAGTRLVHAERTCRAASFSG